jgi:ATP-dependent helicase/nuclease subunit A
MPSRAWTKSQRLAIDAEGASVLVSAGAGSGKTAVLAERCAALAADPSCPIDRMLVVTFTDAAATEMRQRIGLAIRERLAATPNNSWLQRQLALLDSAWISTIHSFCRRVLNRYFAQADVDPLTPVLEANEAELLRRESAQRIFDEWADREDPAGEAFLDLLANYGGTSEEQLVGCVLRLDAFLSSLPSPEAWMEACRERFASQRPDRLSSWWLERLRAELAGEIERQHAAAAGLVAALRDVPEKAAPAVESLTAHRDALDGWLTILRGNADEAVIDRLCREDVAGHEPPKPPRRDPRVLAKLSASEQQAFLAVVEAAGEVRDVFTKRLRSAYGRFSLKDWAEGIARTGPHAVALLDLARSVRQAYQAAKRDFGVIDFGDLERFTLDLLRNEEAGAARHLRDRFLHVLVDEFQDVSPIQAEILRLVSREAEDTRPGNLFTVGDVKQCIYRFRLAEPRLFIERRDSFNRSQDADSSERPRPWPGGGEEVEGALGERVLPGGADVETALSEGAAPDQGRGLLGGGIAIDLVKNFRSRPAVIDAINAVFERIMARDLGGVDYDEHARLVAGKKSEGGEAGPAIELHVLDDARGSSGAGESAEEEGSTDAGEGLDWEQIEREAYAVADRIKALAVAGTPYRDVVVLLRSFQAHAGLFVRTLARLDVPVFAEVSGGFFEAAEVQDVLSLLMLLDNQQQDIPLAAVLRSPLVGRPLTDSQLAELAAAARRAGGDTPFHDAVRRYARNGVNVELRAKLADIFDRLAQWRRRIRRRPLADVLWGLYEETGYFAYAAGLRDGRQRQANLLQLHEHARRFDGFARQGLHRFLRFIDGLRDAGQDLEPGSVASPAGDVVRVMTVHRSKGLEFPVVVLADLGKRFNRRDSQGAILFDRKLGLGMEAVDLERRIRYPTLPHRLVAGAVWAESLAEEMRILYVALTRAKEKLVLVGTGRLESLLKEQERYAGHAGPLPLLDRLQASSMLDWLWAAVCCQSNAAMAVASHDGVRRVASCRREVLPRAEAHGVPVGHGGPTLRPTVECSSCFAIRTYAAEEMRQWSIDPPERTGVTEALRRIASAEPLGDVFAGVSEDRADAEVRLVERRLTTAYRAAALTVVPAVAAASVLKGRWETRQDAEEPMAELLPSEPPAAATHSSRRFRTPEFLGQGRAADPAARGTWTHEFLQRVDLRRNCDAGDLRDQLEGMKQAGLLAELPKATIDIDAAAWFFQSDLGRRTRSASTTVLREWPFVLEVDARRYDPAAAPLAPDDIMLVRGIIDCLFDSGSGWEVVDYKTDAVSEDGVAARAEVYRGQLAIYAAAAEAAWNRPVGRRWLVFLSPRQIVEV